MLNLGHKNLDVFKCSIELTKEIYRVTSKFPKEEIYVLVSQLRRSSISVASNISEGFARESKVETKRFLDIARSSLVELDTQIIISNEFGYIAEKDLIIINELIQREFSMLSKLINKYKY
jgi:four helix bundle protein